MKRTLPFSQINYEFSKDKMVADVANAGPNGKPYGITLYRKGRKPLFIPKVIVDKMAEKMSYKEL